METGSSYSVKVVFGECKSNLLHVLPFLKLLLLFSFTACIVLNRLWLCSDDGYVFFVIIITCCVKIASLFTVVDGQKIIANFFAPLRRLRYKKGEIILRPDNLSPGVNFVEKGHIKVYSITEDGNEKTHIIFKSGAIFPLLWVFKDINRDVYYEALDEVLLKKATKEDFIDFINGNLGAMRELVGKMLTTLDVYVDRIEELEYQRSYPRLISSLLTFIKHFGRKVGKTILIDVPLTHRDIGSSINMTRETVSRDMEKLINKKIIAYKRHLIVVRNLDRLKQELAEYSSGDEA